MYTIYMGDKLIYSPTLYREYYDIIDPTLTQELNRADSLSFIIPPQNPNYDEITKLKPEIKVYDDTNRVFRGRVVQTDKDFQNLMSVAVEGELSYFGDVVLRPYDYQQGTVKGYFTQLITNYNESVDPESVDPWKRFVVGKCDVIDADGNNNITRANKNYPTVLEEIQDKLIDKLGGYLIPRVEKEDGDEVNYIDYLKMEQSTNTGAQVIRFAENLLDLNDVSDTDNIYTVIVPLGAKGENETRLGIADYVPEGAARPWGKDYIENADGITKFGRIERVVIWDDVTIAENLWKKANAAVSSASSDLHSIELTALDMHDFGVNVDALKIGLWYRLISVPHGYRDGNEDRPNTFQLSRVVRKLQNPDKSTYTFGRVQPVLTRR